jgi:alkane 1-monooxygenase
VARPYEALRSMPQAPQLPAGYPAMVVVALVPPLWFALMHRRLAALAA